MIDIDKLGCTLSSLANICQHKSTIYKFYPFCESDKGLCEKIREDVTSGPSIVFTRKAVFDKTFIGNSTNVCKSIVGVDASQLYPYSMCQDMTTRLYTRWKFDTDMQNFKARNNRTRNFEIMVIAFFPGYKTKIESFSTSGKQKKIYCFKRTVIVITVRQCSKQWDITSTFVLVKKLIAP